MSDTQIWLALSDTSLAGAISLTDRDKHWAVEGSWNAPPAIEPEEVLAGSNKRSSTQNSQNQAVERVITIDPLFIQGGSQAALQLNYNEIQNMLDRAPRAMQPQGVGPYVVLWVKFPQDADWTFYDVKWGDLTRTKMDAGQNQYYLASLELHCLPYGRGTSKTYTVSGTITDGTNPVYMLPAPITSDGGARLQLKIADTSTSGTAINRIRIATRHMPGMASSDFVSTTKLKAALPTIQQITVQPNLSTGWQFSLTWNGHTTGTIGSGSGSVPTLAQVQAALDALTGLGAGTTKVTGGRTSTGTDSGGAAPGQYVVTFIGSLASAAQPLMTATMVSTVGGATIATISTGFLGSIVYGDGGFTYDGLFGSGTAVRYYARGAPDVAANAAQPTGSLTVGTFDVYLRGRDSSIPNTGPIVLSYYTTAANSGFPSDGYTLLITSIDTNGVESSPSAPLFLNLYTDITPVITAVVPAAATAARVYFKGSAAAAWQYQDMRAGIEIDASGVIFSSLAYNAGVLTHTADPPTWVPQQSATIVKLRTAIASTTPTWIDGKYVPFQLNNNQLEHLYMGTFVLPPAQPIEGRAAPAYQFQVLGQAGGAYTANVDLDCLILLPNEPGEARLDARINGLANTTPLVWIIDTDRQMRATAQLFQSDGVTAAGAADVTGRLHIGQGNTMLCFMVEGAKGVTDIQHLSWTVQVTVTPLFRTSGGV